MNKNWISSAQCVIVSLLFPLASYANAQSSTEKFWFKPALIKNSSTICPDFLNQVKRAFINGEKYPVALENIGEVLIGDYYQGAKTDHVLINNKSVYVRFALSHGCGGACEGEQVIASTEPIDNNKIYTTDFDSKEKSGMPAAADYGNSRFIKASDQNYYLVSVNESIQIHQVNADASWTNACEISIKPTEQDYTKSSEATATREAVSRLKKSLEPIMGSYGNCGSLRAGQRRLASLSKNLETVIYRPWELEKQNSYTEGAFEYLEKWSIKGIPQNSSYKVLMSELKKTVSVAKNLYAKQYSIGIEEAERLAEAAIKNSIGIAVNPAFPPQPEDRKKVLEVLFEKGDISIIKALSADLASLDATENGGDTLIAAAINYPEALEYLLQQGLSPNTPNDFGKTPLMYAAQYNQLNSVEMLLNAGALVNEQTIIPNDDCNFTLSKSGMTALHYAVRYASKELVDVLLARGANPYAKTSENSGGRPIDWLRRYTASSSREINTYLNKDDVGQLEKKLEMPLEEDIIKIVKKLNLEAEKQFQEGKKDEAYLTIKKALNIDPLNDRALANYAFIAVRTGKIMEGLAASQTVIANSSDVNQKANALFNYALACEDGNIRYERYNGETYCRKYPLHYLLESYKLKPSEGKVKRIIKTLKDGATPSCNFSFDIYVVGNLSYYGSGELLYVLHLKKSALDKTSITWSKDEKKYQPENLKESYDLGDYALDIYESPVTIYTPITYGNQVCSSKSFNQYAVSGNEN
jgi:ankyrin repeat protein